jgi:hypothetical protein
MNADCSHLPIWLVKIQNCVSFYFFSGIHTGKYQPTGGILNRMEQSLDHSSARVHLFGNAAVNVISYVNNDIARRLQGML